MNRSKLFSILSVILFAVFGVALVTTAQGFGWAQGQAAKPLPKQAAKPAPKEEELFPHMDQALGYLGACQKQLQQAEAVFGGHREKALTHVNAAMSDIQAGISEFLAKHPTATRNEVNPDSIPVKPGHHMEEAFRLAQQAQGELNRAWKQYAGKREEALNEVKAAIAETEMGLAYEKAHTKK